MTAVILLEDENIFYMYNVLFIKNKFIWGSNIIFFPEI